MKPKRPSLTSQEMIDHLPKVFDFTLITLKGHLLMESALDDYLHSQLKKPSVLLDKTRLQFDTKVKLANALTDDIPGYAIWPAAENLNKIRNSLAHRLTDANLDNLRRDFVKLVADLGYSQEPDDDKDQVYTGCIAFLIGMLQGMAESEDI